MHNMPIKAKKPADIFLLLRRFLELIHSFLSASSPVVFSPYRQSLQEGGECDGFRTISFNIKLASQQDIGAATSQFAR